MAGALRNSWPISWMFWHPHQRLWNDRLVGVIETVIPARSISRPVRGMVMLVDTSLLFIRAVLRRLSLFGFSEIFTKWRTGYPVLYLDIGTHKQGAELALMTDAILPRVCIHYEAYGFEANQESFRQARVRFSKKRHVILLHKALCNAQGKIRLYHNAGSGLADSLYRQADSFEDVEAVRLSDWLREKNISLEDRICLLRMNIEGAEFDVLQDLVESGLATNVDGYYGMWDDVSKINVKRDVEFREFLSTNGISSMTFNGRDVRWRFRMKCIEYDMNTSVMVGSRRLERRINAPTPIT